MLSKVRDTIEQYNMISRGDTIYAAVSGGADSVCLLLVLEELQRELDFQLKAIHVEHGIRGQESIDDANFVGQLCEQLDIELKSYSVDASEYAAKHGLSLEEGARILRYECFDNDDIQGKVAVAHHMEDNAETILFNMVRGSGIEGLRGIKKVRDNIIRPLINVSRGEIEHFLEERGQGYRIDSTNEDSEYTRNYIRHEVMPNLVNVNSRAIEHINELSAMQDMAVDYISKQVDKACDRYVNEGRIYTDLLDEEDIIITSVIHRVITGVSGTAKDISSVHIKSVLDIIKGNGGRKVHLPYNLEAVSNYDWVEIRAVKQTQMTEDETVVITAEDIEQGVIVEYGTRRIKLSVEPVSAELEISANTYTKTLDYDRIIGCIAIRTRRSGDYIVVDAKGSRKSIKRYMIDSKIPRENRDGIMLICDEDQVMWVVGHRISEYYKVTSATTRVLRIEVTDNE